MGAFNRCERELARYCFWGKQVLTVSNVSRLCRHGCRRSRRRFNDVVVQCPMPDAGRDAGAPGKGSWSMFLVSVVYVPNNVSAPLQ